jgi:hypothetical protein
VHDSRRHGAVAELGQRAIENRSRGLVQN